MILVACPQYWDGIVDTRPSLKAYVDGMQVIDFDLIKSLSERIYLFHGTNDHILSQKDVAFLQDQFGEKAKTFISDSYGHFDVDAIPELLDVFVRD
jgi:predicted alpha/beta hydrolase family esterase